MRVAILLIGLLATAATPPGCGAGTSAGSGTSVITDPWDPSCQGHSCGDSCAYCPPGYDPKACPVPTVVATACNVRGQCVTAGTFLCEGETCDGRWCGVSCDGQCPFGAPCPAPVACDGHGACVPATPSLCYDPCAGLACGATCLLCPPGDPTCAETTVLKVCDRDGACVPSPPARSCQ